MYHRMRVKLIFQCVEIVMQACLSTLNPNLHVLCYPYISMQELLFFFFFFFWLVQESLEFYKAGYSTKILTNKKSFI